ncbi:helix-turn-helix domain-containing protein [Bacteroides heparinolyticus]|uniref:helix-turn-helix domain-containing protein n=1 Tax=Prevotella heparinolytica TaxID=28113 RepID=UPI00359FABAD
MDSILENIRKIRESKGYTQEVIADKLKMTQAKYARFERGATKTDLSIVRKVADFFEMSLVDLISYPQKLIDPELIEKDNRTQQEVKATLSIEMGKERKDQVFRFLFGENNVEILNK